MLKATAFNNDHWISSSTHYPILAAVVANTSGPVLELGMGYGSTPMLHEMCLPTRRRLVSADDSPDWMAIFEYLRCEWHEFHEVPGRQLWPQQEWGSGWAVVFVDHGCAETRKDSILQFAHGEADWVVAHDATPPWHQKPYEYQRAFDAFRHRYLFDDVHPNTIILSNLREWV